MLTLHSQDRFLIARFDLPQIALSWAIHGGGQIQTQKVVWHQVSREDLAPPVDPKQFLQQQLALHDLSESVGMLTSAKIQAYSVSKKSYQDISVHAIATVGMSNALRIGDKPREGALVGTINLLCALSQPLTDEARLEALSLAAEARTAVVLEADIPSTETGLKSTGTGTDCIVITSPQMANANQVEYVGKHTVIGHLIGASVYEAVSNGLTRWKQNSSA